MKLHNYLFLIPLLLSTHAYAFRAEVTPREVGQGDAFIIKVTRVESNSMPSASLSDRSFHFSRCGKDCFIAIGVVDIEVLPGKYTVRLSVGNDRADLNFRVRGVSFETVSMALPEDKVSLSPEDMKRAEREAERLKSIWQGVSDKLWAGGFIMPLGNSMSTSFGAKRIINQKKVSVHKGVDIKGKEGESVKASNRGRVVLAEELFFGGNTVILDHGQGIYTVYMHLSGFNVGTGDVVLKGDIIGYVGSSGRASGPHLHFGVKVSDINANPVSFVKLRL